MKIEKVNDNQIRCTLTKEDLASRELKISELAYGSEKAKSLFRDMMQQANFEFGFEAENFPLMIEAIPLNGECIVLVITKVEDPEELDTRFSRFAPSPEEALAADQEDTDSSKEMLDLFRKIKAAGEDAPKENETSKSAAAPKAALIHRLFEFQTLSHVMDAASSIPGDFSSHNSLYKNKQSRYVLHLSEASQNTEALGSFHACCNILLEYGQSQKVSDYTPEFLEEHYELVIGHRALQALRQ